MSEYKYFYPDGEEITGGDENIVKQRFIKFYSRIYRYVNHKQWDSEVEMENYLGRDNDIPLITMEIANILAWKANRKMDPSKDAPYEINSRGGTMTIEDELWEDDKFKQFCGLGHKIDCESAQKFIRFLVGCDPEISQPDNEIASRARIKFVYAIAILYFISKGRYPIYDRYAHVGLKSIEKGGNPTKKQDKIPEKCYNRMFHAPSRDKEIGGKKVISEGSFKKAWEDYEEYANLLKKVMGEKSMGVSDDARDWSASDCRDVDRALWAYGHLFYEPYEKKKKEDDSDNE